MTLWKNTKLCLDAVTKFQQLQLLNKKESNAVLTPWNTKLGLDAIAGFEPKDDTLKYKASFRCRCRIFWQEIQNSPKDDTIE
jgi:hypothetical protein